MTFDREELKAELKTHSLHGGCGCGSKIQCEDREEWLLAKIAELGKKLSPEARKARYDEHMRCINIISDYRELCVLRQSVAYGPVGKSFENGKIRACADVLSKILMEYKND